MINKQDKTKNKTKTKTKQNKTKQKTKQNKTKQKDKNKNVFTMIHSSMSTIIIDTSCTSY